MQHTTVQETCHWIKPDGNRCEDNRLVPDAQYCHKHYWQALWARTEQAKVPLPAKTVWWPIIGAIVGLILGMFDLYISDNWIFLDWWRTLMTVLNNPQIIKTNSSLLWSLLGWFALGANLSLIVFAAMLVFCVFPLQPKVRRRLVQICLTLIVIFYLILVSTITVLYTNFTFYWSGWIYSFFGK
jgi:hypothetical protein